MADLISMLAACGATEGEPTDPDFNQTVLLLHGDGTNGAQNNTFLDGSTNNFTITRNGNTTQGTFSPFSNPDGYWSNFFDGTNDRLTIADNAALRPGTSAFTIEAWVYRAAAGAAHTIFAKGASTPTGFAFLITSSDTLRFTDTSTDITSTGTVAANTWVHVAAVREGTGSNQLKLYINGVQDGTGTSSTNFTQTEEARIGENRGATDDFNGYISNFRYVIGTALYTAGFTPSTSPLTTTSQGATSSQVELLTCQSNRFVDNSTNAFAITSNGDVRVTPFSPFAPSAAYSASTNGGSGYFDGSGDYLAAPADSDFDFSTGDFTFECWFWQISRGNLRGPLAQLPSASDGAWRLSVNDGSSNDKIQFVVRVSGGWSTVIDVSATWGLNCWNHIALSRSGTTLRAFANGVLLSTVTFSSAVGSSTYAPTIGYLVHDNVYFTGYITDARLVKGTAVYTAAFTSPTAPLTAIANTSLLCNFTNAGIFDNTGKNVLETVGNAQIDTTTKKFGTGSMEFDGTGDGLNAPDSPQFDMGSGDFTVEMWVYANSLSGEQFLVGQNNSASYYAPFRFAFNGSQLTAFMSTTGSSWSLRLEAGSSLSTSTWYHIALVRNGTSFKIYVNGTQYDSGALSGALYNSTDIMRIGWASIGAGNFVLNGYIDDLRITKGVARYTANFTPPTAAFPNL